MADSSGYVSGKLSVHTNLAPQLSSCGSMSLGLEPRKSLAPAKSMALSSLGGLGANGALLTGRQQAQADTYLSELLSYSLDRLKKEPEILQEERAGLERGLQTAAVTQYGAFIEAANCLNTISSELDAVHGHLDKLLQGIPELAASCEAFSAQSSAVLTAYAQNKQLAGQQGPLLELLEVPQLMDTCARNGVYDEALDLQAFVSRLALLHPNLPLVRLLMTQVNEVGASMLQQLLGRLRTGIQLPECLRIMGYLRRLGTFTETDLRLHFLKCRDEWISGLIAECDDSDAYEYVKHLTDVHRLQLFDAVMQYRAIFFDASPPPAAPSSALPGGTGGSGAAAALAAAQQDAAALVSAVRETGLLHSWVQHRLSLYGQALREHLPAITQGGNLASVLEHCQYCGTSLARVGLDFTPLLHPLFEACSLQLLSNHLAAAVDGFTARLETHKWVPLHAPLPGGKRQSDSAARTDAACGPSGSSRGGPGGSGGGTGEDGGAPPYLLMEHLPLAIFTNGVLTALNETRQCALQSCAAQAAGLLQQATEHMASSLAHYRATHTLSDSEAPLLRATTRAALDVLLPYLAACFARVYVGTGHKLDCSGAATILRSMLQDG